MLYSDGKTATISHVPTLSFVSPHKMGPEAPTVAQMMGTKGGPVESGRLTSTSPSSMGRLGGAPLTPAKRSRRTDPATNADASVGLEKVFRAEFAAGIEAPTKREGPPGGEVVRTPTNPSLLRLAVGSGDIEGSAPVQVIVPNLVEEKRKRNKTRTIRLTGLPGAQWCSPVVQLYQLP